MMRTFIQGDVLSVRAGDSIRLGDVGFKLEKNRRALNRRQPAHD
jgi:hypothetical protein